MQQLYPQCIDIFRDNPKMVRTPSKGVMSGNVWKGGEIHFVSFFIHSLVTVSNELLLPIRV